MRPTFKHIILPSGAELVRFSTLAGLFWYDVPKNNPNGVGIKGATIDNMYNKTGLEKRIQKYLKSRNKITKYKLELIQEAKKNLSTDKDFLNLVHKSKSIKRKFVKNKFVGNLSMVDYASQNSKIFSKGVTGAKKQTISMAFQVGTFIDGNYTDSFVSIIKTILMAQALNINLDIDVFDSDIAGINGGPAYVICNVADSSKKLNLKNLLVFSHEEFFNFTLFNGYSAAGKETNIRGFLPSNRIIEDLSDKYDIIGGNQLTINDEGKHELIKKVFKISGLC